MDMQSTDVFIVNGAELEYTRKKLLKFHAVLEYIYIKKNRH